MATGYYTTRIAVNHSAPDGWDPRLSPRQRLVFAAALTDPSAPRFDEIHHCVCVVHCRYELQGDRFIHFQHIVTPYLPLPQDQETRDPEPTLSPALILPSQELPCSFQSSDPREHWHVGDKITFYTKALIWLSADVDTLGHHNVSRRSYSTRFIRSPSSADTSRVVINSHLGRGHDRMDAS